jgi:hypothetical protein
MAPILVCSLLLCLGLLVMDYLRCRTQSYEDRYMAIYGRWNWESCNMVLRLSFGHQHDLKVKSLFQRRLAYHLLRADPDGSLFHEKPRIHAKGIGFYYDAGTDLDELKLPRKGIYLDDNLPGNLSIVWNHIQSDGIRLWRTLKPLFDANEEILDFNPPKVPPAFIPEFLAIPTTIKRMFLRYNLKSPQSGRLHYGFKMWQTQPIKQIRDRKKIPSFNIVTAALILQELFHRHEDVDRLTVGMTVAFTFLDAKNQYGLITLDIIRCDFDGLCRQIVEQAKHPIRIWGAFSAQTYLLSFFPDWLFKKVINYFRGQLDVLISSLPLGRDAAKINGVPITLSCHPKELTIPYYFLLMGAGPHIHISFTNKYGVARDFMCQDRLIAAV